ncbi:MAG: helix-turn-helix domain-containing protein [Pseudomonadota bacterium]
MLKRDLVFFVYPGIKLLDLSGPLQVFSDANDCAAVSKFPYRVSVVSMSGGPVQTDTLLQVDTTPAQDLARRRLDTFVVVGGQGALEASQEQRLVDAVRALSARSRRVVSICSGTFLLAAAGLLEGKRVVTHWDACDLLAQLYPNLSVQRDRIFVNDGQVWTSAGVTAGIDLSLALVQEDWGRSVALSIARRLVTYMVRPGGQSQFSDVLELQIGAASSRFSALIEWIQENPSSDLCVTELAERANMSSRSFSRRFRDEVGSPPAKFVESVRVAAARRLLEESTASVYSIAHECGFGDEERMRRAFLRKLNASPSEYRARFV